MLDRPARIASEKGLGDDAIAEAVSHVRGELGCVTNLFSRASYKKQMASVLVRRALVALREI